MYLISGGKDFTACNKKLLVIFRSILDNLIQVFFLCSPADAAILIQGRDKDCILISFVRSSEKITHYSSSLLGDWHRINVALTRAKVCFSNTFPHPTSPHLPLPYISKCHALHGFQSLRTICPSKPSVLKTLLLLSLKKH